MENERCHVAYVQIDVDIFENIKTKRAARDLKLDPVHFVGHLASLWAWCFKFAPDGSLHDSDESEIAEAAKFEDDDASRFCSVLHKRGWLDKKDDHFLIHDWEENTGRILKSNAKTKVRMERHRSKKDELVTRNSTVTEREQNANQLRNATPLLRSIIKENNIKEININEKNTDRACAHVHEENTKAEVKTEPIGSLEDAGAPPDFISDSEETFLALTDKQDHATLAVIPNAKQNSVATPKNNKQRHAFESADFDLALDWISWAHEQHPHLKLQAEACAKEIRISRDNTGRTIEQMRNIFEWIKQDDFWSKNCLSPCALNKKSSSNGLRKIDNIINSISKDKKTVEKMQYDQWKDEGIKPLF
jgi:hypothetical protein